MIVFELPLRQPEIFLNSLSRFMFLLH